MKQIITIITAVGLTLCAFCVTAVGIFALTGCIAQPGSRINVYVGYRSAQCETTTNISNSVEGGGSLKAALQ